MITLFRYIPNALEVHQYTQDLERITMLRNKARTPEEMAEYDNILHCMRMVLIVINGGKHGNTPIKQPSLD